MGDDAGVIYREIVAEREAVASLESLLYAELQANLRVEKRISERLTRELDAVKSQLAVTARAHQDAQEEAASLTAANITLEEQVARQSTTSLEQDALSEDVQHQMAIAAASLRRLQADNEFLLRSVGALEETQRSATLAEHAAQEQSRGLAQQLASLEGELRSLREQHSDASAAASHSIEQQLFDLTSSRNAALQRAEAAEAALLAARQAALDASSLFEARLRGAASQAAEAEAQTRELRSRLERVEAGIETHPVVVAARKQAEEAQRMAHSASQQSSAAAQSLVQQLEEARGSANAAMQAWSAAVAESSKLREASDAALAEVSSLRPALEAAQAEAAEFRGRATAAEAGLADTRARCLTLEEQLRVSQSRAQAAEAATAVSSAASEEHFRAAAAATTELLMLRAQAAEASASLFKMQRDTVGDDARLAALQGEMAALTRDRDAARAELSAAQAAATQAAAAAAAELAGSASRCSSAEARAGELEKRVRDYSVRLADARVTVDKSRGEAAAAGAEAKALREQVTRLQGDLASVRALQRRGSGAASLPPLPGRGGRDQLGGRGDGGSGASTAAASRRGGQMGGGAQDQQGSGSSSSTFSAPTPPLQRAQEDGAASPQQLQRQLEDARAGRADALRQLESATQLLAELRARWGASQGEATDMWRQKEAAMLGAEEARADADAVRAALDAAVADGRSAVAAGKTLGGALSDSRQALAESRLQEAAARDELRRTQEELARASAALREAEKVRVAQESAAADAVRIIKELHRGVTEAEAQLAIKESEAEALHARVTAATQDSARLAEELRRASSSLSALNQTLAERDAAVAALQDALQQARGSAEEQAGARVRLLQRQLEEARAAMQRSRDASEDSARALQSLAAERDAISASCARLREGAALSSRERGDVIAQLEAERDEAADRLGVAEARLAGALARVSELQAAAATAASSAIAEQRRVHDAAQLVAAEAARDAATQLQQAVREERGLRLEAESALAGAESRASAALTECGALSQRLAARQALEAAEAEARAELLSKVDTLAARAAGMEAEYGAALAQWAVAEAEMGAQLASKDAELRELQGTAAAAEHRAVTYQRLVTDAEARLDGAMAARQQAARERDTLFAEAAELRSSLAAAAGEASAAAAEHEEQLLQRRALQAATSSSIRHIGCQTDAAPPRPVLQHASVSTADETQLRHTASGPDANSHSENSALRDSQQQQRLLQAEQLVQQQREELAAASVRVARLMEQCALLATARTTAEAARDRSMAALADAQAAADSAADAAAHEVTTLRGSIAAQESRLVDSAHHLRLLTAKLAAMEAERAMLAASAEAERATLAASAEAQRSACADAELRVSVLTGMLKNAPAPPASPPPADGAASRALLPSPAEGVPSAAAPSIRHLGSMAKALVEFQKRENSRDQRMEELAAVLEQQRAAVIALSEAPEALAQPTRGAASAIAAAGRPPLYTTALAARAAPSASSPGARRSSAATSAMIGNAPQGGAASSAAGEASLSGSVGALQVALSEAEAAVQHERRVRKLMRRMLRGLRSQMDGVLLQAGHTQEDAFSGRDAAVDTDSHAADDGVVTSRSDASGAYTGGGDSYLRSAMARISATLSASSGGPPTAGAHAAAFSPVSGPVGSRRPFVHPTPAELPQRYQFVHRDR